MRTAEYCRHKAEEMERLAATSSVTRDQFLQMAAEWYSLERESARVEGLVRDEATGA